MHKLIHYYVNKPNRNNYFFDNIAISVILKNLVKNVAKRFRVKGCIPGHSSFLCNIIIVVGEYLLIGYRICCVLGAQRIGSTPLCPLCLASAAPCELIRCVKTVFPL